MVKKHAILDSKTPEKMKHSQSMLEDAQLPIEQKKRKIQRNLRTLEQAGLVSSANKYQEIINEIAKVIGMCCFKISKNAPTLSPYAHVHVMNILLQNTKLSRLKYANDDSISV